MNKEQTTELNFPVSPQKFVEFLDITKEKKLYPRIILPSFQRDQVWNSRQICEFWDSLMRGIPLPSIIISRVKDSLNSITKKDNVVGEITPIDYWLLDGQQRAMAIKCGLSIDQYSVLSEKRLWLDIGWEVSKDDQFKRKFGFFLCSKARPWGHANDFGTPNRKKIQTARAEVHETYPLHGCFDFKIPLKYTWPVHAQCPIPFFEFVQWALQKKQSLTEEDIVSKIDDLTIFTHNFSTDQLLNIAKSLKDGILQLNKPTISAVVSDMNDDDLLTTFTRLNRNGTQVNQAELFYSALKRDNPQYNKLLVEARENGEAFNEFDVLRGVTILGSQGKKDSSQYEYIVGGTTLSLDLLKTIKNATKIYSKFNFNDKLKHYLDDGLISELLRITVETIRYNKNNRSDFGLPVLMIPRLKVRSWLPVLSWIEYRGIKKSTDINSEDRKSILSYLLVDHFFADWNKQEDQLLRGLIDLVQKVGSQKKPFPSIIEIENFFKNILEIEGQDGKSAWRKSVYLLIDEKVDTTKTAELPLALEQIQKRIKLHCCRQINPPANDGKIWNKGRWIDLLMWAQRQYLEEWFGSDLKDIAILGKTGKPWDKDHIVPHNFFNDPANNKNVTPEIVYAALQSAFPGIYRFDESKYSFWDVRWGWRHKTGNFRIWPQGFNRKDQDMGVTEKLDQRETIDEYRVLSQWWNDNVGTEKLSAASAINDVDNWQNTTSQKGGWDQKSLTAFFKAVSCRELEIYTELYNFIKQGFDKIK